MQLEHIRHFSESVPEVGVAKGQLLQIRKDGFRGSGPTLGSYMRMHSRQQYNLSEGLSIRGGTRKSGNQNSARVLLGESAWEECLYKASRNCSP